MFFFHVSSGGRLSSSNRLYVLLPIRDCAYLRKNLLNRSSRYEKATCSVPDCEIEVAYIRFRQWVILIPWLAMEVVHHQESRRTQRECDY
jgi:hypothetical protein